MLTTSSASNYVRLFTGIRTLDFKVGYSGNTSVDELYHVNFVLSFTYDLKCCVLLFNMNINGKN